MPVEGSNQLGPDEAIKRQLAELLQADVYDVAVLLVSAYANNILPDLRPCFPHTLPPDAISNLGLVQDAVMAWASDAADHRGTLEYSAIGGAIPSRDISHLLDLAYRDAQVRAGLRDTVKAITTAAQALSSLSPSDPAWSTAMETFNQAMRQLDSFSGQLLGLPAKAPDPKTVRVPLGDPYERDAGRARLQQAVDQAFRERSATSDMGAAERARHVVRPDRGHWHDRRV